MSSDVSKNLDPWSACEYEQWTEFSECASCSSSMSDFSSDSGSDIKDRMFLCSVASSPQLPLQETSCYAALFSKNMKSQDHSCELQTHVADMWLTDKYSLKNSIGGISDEISRMIT